MIQAGKLSKISTSRTSFPNTRSPKYKNQSFVLISSASWWIISMIFFTSKGTKKMYQIWLKKLIRWLKTLPNWRPICTRASITMILTLCPKGNPWNLWLASSTNTEIFYPKRALVKQTQRSIILFRIALTGKNTSKITAKMPKQSKGANYSQKK